MPESRPQPGQGAELFLSTRDTSKRTSEAVAAGRARKIGPRLYTGNMTDEPKAIVRRNLWPAVSLLAPGTVIGYRTALEMAPAADGTVFLTGTTRKGQVEVPGITLRLIPGPGPLEGDQPLFNLHIASRPRALLEVLKPPRARATVARGLPRSRVEEELERELRIVGEDRLNRIRDQARVIAPVLEAEREFAVLDGIIGALLGTRRGRLSAPAAVARAAGEPYDAGRLDRFQVLHAALVRWIPRPRPDALTDNTEFANVAFFDAYFSNFIEGTRFEIAEAREIALEGKIPLPGRQMPMTSSEPTGWWKPHDDGTGRARLSGLRPVPERAAGCPRGHSLRPTGQAARGIKEAGERGRGDRVRSAGAGARHAPAGIRAGEESGGAVRPGGRDDVRHLRGAPVRRWNGRIARAFMNAELVSGGERRILIPTVYRDEYVTGLRVHTRQGHPDPLIKTLDFAQEYVARIDFSDYDRALGVLRETGAFQEPRADVV